MKVKLLLFSTFFTAAMLKDVRCQFSNFCILDKMKNVIFTPSFENPPLCNDIERNFKLTRELLKSCTRKEISIDEYEDLVKDYCDPESDIRNLIDVNWKYLFRYIENCGRLLSDETESITKYGSNITTTEVEKKCESLYGLSAICLHNQFQQHGSSVQNIFDRGLYALKCPLIGQCYISMAACYRAIDNVRDDGSIKKLCTKRHPDISSGTIATGNIQCFWFITVGLLISSVFKYQI